ncbi:protein-glutamate methylesterase/protein-glutamine glutaminase [Ureibacillus acetophenoni]|uniref:Protein-glutamate methylesterase/protein-glutamine glutaminase n=1 Tax=Ureibacillus acetophenoni TaxID=614649 RepID=A0A285U0Y1_9BACL|nr:chemotaxis response regulator protein-glutamate methylesterase [Ureibacillus acetophenoni]SOC35565.1 two-component system chemotaxis response regulator CheB [Ureibacillus acetophenoni]
MGFSKKSKLLIVDDSAFMRKLISDFFHDHPNVEVIGTARNGKDAIKKIQQLQPDVVTMDVEMPELNGLDALKQIMQLCPVPVIMLSSETQSGADTTLTAMEYGAVDFVAKPGGMISLDLHKVKEELIQKVLSVADVSITKLRKPIGIQSLNNQIVKPKLTTPITKSVQQNNQSEIINKVNHQFDWNKLSKKIVLIGTSTGGPRALQEVITNIPETINAPILIVQHMPKGFTKSLAERLNQLSKIRVKEAENGEVIENGTAYIAPGGFHLKLKKVRNHFEIVIDQTEPPRSGHRPSVDVMFENVSCYDDFDKIAVIMTGMGSDGSKGLRALKNSGKTIAIAESQETCIVYGMPKAAVETKLIDEITCVEDIAHTITKYL